MTREEWKREFQHKDFKPKLIIPPDWLKREIDDGKWHLIETNGIEYRVDGKLVSFNRGKAT